MPKRSAIACLLRLTRRGRDTLRGRMPRRSPGRGSPAGLAHPGGVVTDVAAVQLDQRHGRLSCHGSDALCYAVPVPGPFLLPAGLAAVAEARLPHRDGRTAGSRGAWRCCAIGSSAMNGRRGGGRPGGRRGRLLLEAIRGEVLRVEV